VKRQLQDGCAVDQSSHLPPRYALPDRRLRFGFFHHRRANWLAFFHETNLAVLAKPVPAGIK
jgi:hypothetical protein